MLHTPARLAAALAVLGAACTASAQRLGDFNIPSQQPDPRQAAAPPDADAYVVEFNDELGRDVIRGVDEDTGVQDAINAARQLTMVERTMHFIATPSGVGAVASGRDSYGIDSNNENLKLLDQRRAWVRAHLAALNNLAESLDGLSVSGKQVLAEQKISLDIEDDDGFAGVNKQQILEEEIDTLVSTFLRGVVTYTVDDNDETGEVVVTVVTTPKTQGQVGRVAPGFISADSLESGIEAIFADIASRTIPPVGGTVVTVPDTGQVAWVGFGSALARYNRNPEIERENRDDAFRIAKMRSVAALAGVVSGTQFDASAELNDSFAKEIRQFEELFDAAGNREIVQHQQDLVNRLAEQTFNTRIATEVQAKLKGVQHARYEDGRWVWNVAIHFPPAAEAARIIGDGMRNNSPLGNSERRKQGFKINNDGTFRRDADGRLIPRSLGRGTVTPRDDL